MSDNGDMLQAIMAEFQSLKKEMRSGFNKIDELNTKLNTLDEKFTKRLDNLGKQLAYVEDDTPTRQEFNTLGSRVTKLEQSAHIT